MTWSSRSAESSGRGIRTGEPGSGLAVLSALVQAVGTTIVSTGQPRGLDVLGYALLIISGLVLEGRLRHPRVVLVVVAAMTVAYSALDYPAGPTFLALIVAVGAAIRTRHRVVLPVVVTGSFVAWYLLTWPSPGEALAVAAWGAGIGLALEVGQVVERTLRKMEEEQRRLREEQQRRQASEERLRIAQELHDVLGHHLSLINVRAGVGSHLLDRDPEEARAALDTIKQASAEALQEVQSVLSVLNPTDRAAPRAPTPGLDRLDELTVDAGLPVQVTFRGAARPLPAGVDLAAYRIVQEALTNVRRHAGTGATAEVTIDYRPQQLVMQVDDTGAGRAPAAAGNGIGGMRERATTLGGSLTVGPRPGGGWQVRAELPLAAADPADAG
jgi:signal transduction histidine kinase